jgi:hypothetical protein
MGDPAEHAHLVGGARAAPGQNQADLAADGDIRIRHGLRNHGAR